MTRIFLSYRRSDSQDATGRIYDNLANSFSPEAVFRDLDSIPLGQPFSAVLKEALARTAVALIVIGPNWVRATDGSGKRTLADPDDYVRIEVEQALSSSATVIPVLVTNATMPEPGDVPESLRGLLARQAMSVRPDPDFHRDMDRLLGHLQAQLGIERVQSTREDRRRSELKEFLAQVSAYPLPTVDSAEYAGRIAARPRELRDIAEEMAAVGAKQFDRLVPIFESHKRLLADDERRQFEAIIKRVRDTVREYLIGVTSSGAGAAGILPGANLRVQFQLLLTKAIAWEIGRMDGHEPDQHEYVFFLIELEATSGLKT